MKRIIAVTTIVVISLINLQSSAVADVGISVVFSGDEIRIISAWYRDRGSASIRGGWQRKVERAASGYRKAESARWAAAGITDAARRL